MAPACSTSSGPKCMKPGPITRNGYLNFLREFRKSHCGLSAVETVRQGAKKWRSMSEKEKQKYIEMGNSSNAKCIRPGPLTRNGYLNFLREFRKTSCGLSAVETVRQGAKKWKSMSKKDQMKYNEIANKVPAKARRMRSKGHSRMLGGRRRRNISRGRR